MNLLLFWLLLFLQAVVGLNPSTTSAEDIKSLISFEHSRRIEPVVDGLAEIGIDLSSLSR